MVGIVDLNVGIWIGFFISCLVGSLVLPSELPMMNLSHALLPFSWNDVMDVELVSDTQMEGGMLGAGGGWGGGGGGEPWDGMVGVVVFMVGIWIGFFISCLDVSLVLPSELQATTNLNRALLPFSWNDEMDAKLVSDIPSEEGMLGAGGSWGGGGGGPWDGMVGVVDLVEIVSDVAKWGGAAEVPLRWVGGGQVIVELAMQLFSQESGLLLMGVLWGGVLCGGNFVAFSLCEMVIYVVLFLL
jgi:hypothetical protein